MAIITGTTGDDTLIVNSDTTSVQADAGTDTAVFSGNYADYTFSQSDSFVPLMTHNTTGQVVSLFGVGRLQFDDSVHDIYFDIGGNDVSGEFQVNTYTSDNQYYPSTTALADGGFVVTWTSDGQDGSSYGIYAQRYDANGNTQGSEFRVNTYTSNNQSNPSITALNDGGFVITWFSYNQDGSGYGIYAQRYDADGNTQGSEFQVNTYASNDQLYPDTTFADLTYGQQYEFDAVSQSFLYTGSAEDETHITSLVSYPQSTTKTEFTYGSDGSGYANYVRIEDNQTEVDFHISGADYFVIEDYDNTLVAVEDFYGNEGVVFVNPLTGGFEYQTFGLWDKNISDTSGHVGMFSVGVTTPESSIPTSGTASYNGTAIGYASSPEGEIGLIDAKLNAVADFSNRSLALSTTDTIVTLNLDGIDMSMPELNLSGALSYASGSGIFSGDVSTNLGPAGTATGRFYGPNANEIGGVISVQDNLGAIVMGFGAKQQ